MCTIGRLNSVLIGGLACAALGSGCNAPRPPAGPTVAQTDSSAIDDLWDDALHAVRHEGFEPDRQDRVHHVIVTRPVTSAQWYEVWRPDRSDAYCVLESSLHTVRRRATVRISPLSGGRWSVDVRVEIQRVAMAERQATTASAALQMFSSRTPTSEGDMLSTEHSPPRWRDVGRDPVMERRILRQMGLEPGEMVEKDADKPANVTAG